MKQLEEIRQTHAPATDPVFAQKARCIGKALVEAIPGEKADPRINWSMHVFEDSAPNASALPSGDLIVNSGLAKATNNSDELAAAIATPVASAVLKQTQKQLNRRMQAQFQAMASGNPLAQPLALQRLEDDIAITDILEADALARLILRTAGFDPRAQLSLLEHLASGQPLLRRHYAPRILASRTWVEKNALNEEPPGKPCGTAR